MRSLAFEDFFTVDPHITLLKYREENSGEILTAWFEGVYDERFILIRPSCRPPYDTCLIEWKNVVELKCFNRHEFINEMGCSIKHISQSSQSKEEPLNHEYSYKDLKSFFDDMYEVFVAAGEYKPLHCPKRFRSKYYFGGEDYADD